MEITITLAEGARAQALNKALAAYNASHFNEPLNSIHFVQKMVDAQLDSLVGSYLTTSITVVAFLKRFTAEERIAIRTAAVANPAIDDYLKMLDAAGSTIDLTDQITAAGLQALEVAGLLDEGRAAEILAL